MTSKLIKNKKTCIPSFAICNYISFLYQLKNIVQLRNNLFLILYTAMKKVLIIQHFKSNTNKKYEKINTELILYKTSCKKHLNKL